MDNWSETLVNIARKLKEHNIQYILVASGALKVLGVEVTPYDIDIFTTKNNIEKCYKVFQDISVNAIHPYKDETGEYIEFQASLSNVPIEFCELREINPENIMTVKFYGESIPVHINTIETELEKNKKLERNESIRAIEDWKKLRDEISLHLSPFD